MAKTRHSPQCTFFTLLLPIVIAFHAPSPSVSADGRPVYVAGTWQDYLRLVPLSVRDRYVPLLYSPNGKATDAIYQFTDLYSGTLLVLDEKSIDRLVVGQWTQAETIVISQGQQPLALVASILAAALKAPLYFKPPSSDVLKQLRVQQVIAVGDVMVPDTLTVLHLHNLEDARAYYSTLIGHTSVAVLATSDGMAFLAAQVAAYHRGELLLKPAEIRKHRPRYLAWVTEPDAVTFEVVQDLYALCRFTPGSRVYDVGVGILTGLSLHDTALLIARAYAYPEFQGAWRMRVVDAQTDQRSRSHIWREGPFEVVALAGNTLTGESFFQAMQSASQVMVEAHGDPSGLALADGSWPGWGQLANLPPLVFVAEACETGNLTGRGAENSVALRVIGSGAVAYIGSMRVGGVGLVGKHPFVFSTPRTPLGELVRLQNAARMDVDADAPRAILIGEPTFHQFEQEWVCYEVMPAKDGIHVKIISENRSITTTIALELPRILDVAYAEAFLDDGRRVNYVPGSLHFDLPLSTAPAFDHQTVLLEWPGRDGELILYPTRPLGAAVRHIFSDSLIGIQAIFIDLLAQPGIDWAAAMAGAGALSVVWRKRGNMKVKRRWIGLLAGVNMAFLGMVYCTALGFPPPWPVVVAASCGGIVVAWIVPPDHRGPERVALGMILYLAPFLLVWLIAALIGISKHTHILIAWGLSLVGIAYGAATLAAEWITRAAAHLAGCWRS